MRQFNLAVAALAVALGALASPAAAAPGDLDSDFGSGGIVTTGIDAGTADSGNDVAIDGEGNVVVAGSAATGPETAAAAVVRYTPSGTPDSSFGGGDGVVSFQFGSGDSDYVRAVAIDANDRIVVAGFSGFDFAVARLTDSGQPDPSFGGGDGSVITHVGFDRGNAVLIDGSGRILVGGEDFTLLRYTEAGVLDPSFGGGDGIVQTSGLPGGVRGVFLDQRDRIVAAGGGGDLALARYEEDGTLDEDFGEDGRVITELSGEDHPRAAALDSHDRILIAASSFACTPYCRLLARYTPSGKLDPTFAGDGVAMGPDDTLAETLAVDASDRPLLTGHVSGLPGHEEGLLRYLPDGTLDSTFGGGDGIAPAPFGIFEGLALDASQRIVGAGSEVVTLPEEGDFATARFIGGGTPPAAQHTVTIAPVGSGDGAITSGPAGIACGETCAATFGNGEAVTLTTTPGGTSEFTGWSAVSGDPGTCTGTTSPCQVTAGGYTELEARFTSTSSPDPDPGVQPSGGSDQPAPSGGAAALSATPPPAAKKAQGPLRCKKGFRKRKIRGKARCVKVKQPPPRRGGRS